MQRHNNLQPYGFRTRINISLKDSLKKNKIYYMTPVSDCFIVSRSFFFSHPSHQTHLKRLHLHEAQLSCHQMRLKILFNVSNNKKPCLLQETEICLRVGESWNVK